MLKVKNALLVRAVVVGALFSNGGIGIEEERKNDRTKPVVPGISVSSHDKKLIRREKAEKPKIDLEDELSQPWTLNFSQHSIFNLRDLLRHALVLSLEKNRLVKLGQLTLLNVKSKDYGQIKNYIKDYKCHITALALDAPSFLRVRNFTQVGDKTKLKFDLGKDEDSVSDIQNIVNHIVQTSKAKRNNVIKVSNATQEQADEILNDPNIAQLGGVKIWLRPTPSKTEAPNLNQGEENGQITGEVKGPGGREDQAVHAPPAAQSSAQFKPVPANAAEHSALEQLVKQEEGQREGERHDANGGGFASNIAKILAQLPPIGMPERQFQPIPTGLMGEEVTGPSVKGEDKENGQTRVEGKKLGGMEAALLTPIPSEDEGAGIIEKEEVPDLWSIGIEGEESQPEAGEGDVNDEGIASAIAEALAQLADINQAQAETLSQWVASDQSIRKLLTQPPAFDLSVIHVSYILDLLAKADEYSGEEPIKVTLRLYNVTEDQLGEIYKDKNACHIGNLAILTPSQVQFMKVLREIAQREGQLQEGLKPIADEILDGFDALSQLRRELLSFPPPFDLNVSSVHDVLDLLRTARDYSKDNERIQVPLTLLNITKEQWNEILNNENAEYIDDIENLRRKFLKRKENVANKDFGGLHQQLSQKPDKVLEGRAATPTRRRQAPSRKELRPDPEGEAFGPEERGQNLEELRPDPEEQVLRPKEEEQDLEELRPDPERRVFGPEEEEQDIAPRDVKQDREALQGYEGEPILLEDLAPDPEGQAFGPEEGEQDIAPGDVKQGEKALQGYEGIALNWKMTPLEKGIELKDIKLKTGIEIGDKALQDLGPSNMQANRASQNLVQLYCRPYMVSSQ